MPSYEIFAPLVVSRDVGEAVCRPGEMRERGIQELLQLTGLTEWRSLEDALSALSEISVILFAAPEGLESWLKHIHALRPKWWVWENVERVRSDYTNALGHLFGKGVGYVRPVVPMGRLLAEPAVMAAASALGDAFAVWADGRRAAAEALLDREAFREQATENGKFAETRRGQLAKDRSVHPEAKAAIMQGDSDAFLSAVAGLAPEAALACLDAWASFTPANHELTLPSELWSWSKGRVSRRWPPHGLVLGPAYRLAWRQYDSQFWGVPQHRERIYLVAIRSDMPKELDPSNIMFEF